MSFVDEEGIPRGFFSELIVEIAEEHGLVVDFQTLSWQEGMKAVQNGDVDLMPATIYTSDRAKLLDFHENPVMVSWGVLAIDEKTDVNDISELNGKTIVLMKGDQNGLNFQQLIGRFGIACDFITVDKHEEIPSLIAGGRAFGGVFFNSFDLSGTSLHFTNIVFNPVQAFFVTQKGTNTWLLSIIDKELTRSKEDTGSYYYDLQKKYFTMSAIESYIIPVWIKILLLMVFLAVLITLLWLYTLRKIVREKTTALRQSRNALKEKEKLFRLVADHTSGWEYWLLPDGRFNYVSPSCEKMTGYHPDDFYQTPDLINTIVYEKDRGIWHSHTCKHSLENETRYLEFRIRDKRGNIRWVSHECVSMIEEGEFIGYRSSNKDITDLKSAQEKLIHAQKMQAVGILAGGIAHDFNNILTGIIGYAEILREELPGDQQNTKYIDTILAAADRATKLVRQILTFSSQKTTDKEPVDLQEIINEVVGLLRASFPNSIGIDIDINNSTPMVLAESTQVHETLMNLATNSLQAMNEKGRLTISLEKKTIITPEPGIIAPIKPGDYAQISVKDTGCGIKKERLPKVFDPFYTTNRSENGTGLGLSVVYGIMDSHKGNIQLESTPGKGTLVRLFFPITAIEEKEKKVTGQKRPAGEGKILFLDDEETIITWAGTILKNAGYDAVSTGDPEKVTEMLENGFFNFDLVITDLTMPKLNGMELAEVIHRKKPAIPIILCSGFTKKIDFKKAKANGVTLILDKPLKSEDFLSAISETLSV